LQCVAVFSEITTFSISSCLWAKWRSNKSQFLPTTHCNTLQHTCYTLQHSEPQFPLTTHYNTLQHTTKVCTWFCIVFVSRVEIKQERFSANFSPAITLQHTATHCNTLQHTATHCNTLATHCNKLHLVCEQRSNKRHFPPTSAQQQHTATHCNTLATHCNTLQHTCNTLQHTATNLQHTATHCNELATHCNTLHLVCEQSGDQTRAISHQLQPSNHSATHCNILQHTAPCLWAKIKQEPFPANFNPATTHCNTPQHTATHCKTLLHRSTLQHIAPCLWAERRSSKSHFPPTSTQQNGVTDPRTTFLSWRYWRELTKGSRLSTSPVTYIRNICHIYIYIIHVTYIYIYIYIFVVEVLQRVDYRQ